MFRSLSLREGKQMSLSRRRERSVYRTGVGTGWMGHEIKDKWTKTNSSSETLVVFCVNNIPWSHLELHIVNHNYMRLHYPIRY